jgi:hypothetical protein
LIPVSAFICKSKGIFIFSQRKHREIYLKSASNATTKSSVVKREQQPLTSFVKPASKYSSSDHRQKDITNALLHFIEGDLMPLSVVDSPQFQHLIVILDQRYQIPSRKHLSLKLLPDESNEKQNKVKTCLQQAPSVCLTLDLWSNRQMIDFLGMTAHFIQNWTLHSVMLACKRFTGRHTAKNIRHEYEETVSI